MRRVLPLLIGARLAAAAEPVAPYAGPMRPFTLRDIGFQKAAEDEYVESLAFTSSLQGGTSFDLSLVVTNLGVGDNNAGVKSEVSAGGRTESHSEEVGDAWSQKPGRVEIAKTRVEGNLDAIRVWHEAPRYAAELTFRRTARSWRPRNGRTTFGAAGRLFYEFSLPMPTAAVEGRIRLGSDWFPVKGTGYVDHSRTNIYSHEQALRWQRFRGIADGERGERVLVQFARFVTTPKYGSRAVGWLVALAGENLLHESYDWDLALSDLRPDAEHKSYRIAWRYDLRDGAISGHAQAFRQSSRTDYLASMGAIKRMIVKQFAQPIAVSLGCNFDWLLVLPAGERRLAGRGSMSQTFVK